MMMDYMLPKRVMSWKEVGILRRAKRRAALFNDLARYGIKVPKGWEQACKNKDHLSHQAWNVFYNYGAAAPSTPGRPARRTWSGSRPNYPTPSTSTTARVEHYAKEQAEGKRFYNGTLPMLCQVVPGSDVLHRAGRPDKIAYRESEIQGA